jgi:hypothetical protein
MRKFTQAAATALLCSLAGSVVLPAAAQTKAPAPAAIATPKQPALNDMDCRTLLRLGGDERAFTLLYLHGFISGKTNLMLLPTDELAAATDRVIDHCIDKPNDKLLPVFEQARKPR